MKTADFSTLFLVIMMGNRYVPLNDIFVTFCGCSISLSKEMNGDATLHSPPQKEPSKVQVKID